MPLSYNVALRICCPSGFSHKTRRALPSGKREGGGCRAWALLSGPSAPLVLAGNASANLVRNLWAFTTIFCGHFPDGTVQFTEEETIEETRGEWYYRQLLGSADLTGGKLFHILSGNLGHQIEHHLFPDLPSHRYAEIGVEVREICRRYGLPYNTGPLRKQFGSVVRKIVRLALPRGEA